MKREIRGKKWWIALAILAFIGLFGFRIYGLFDCSLGQYDLKRETDYRWLTGRCVVQTNGGWVYIEALRGISNGHHDNVVDTAH